MSFDPQQYMYQRGDDEPLYSTTTRRGNQSKPTQRRKQNRSGQNQTNGQKSQGVSNQNGNRNSNLPNNTTQNQYINNVNQVTEVSQNQTNVQSVPYVHTHNQVQSQYPTYGNQSQQVYQYSPNQMNQMNNNNFNQFNQVQQVKQVHNKFSSQRIQNQPIIVSQPNQQNVYHPVEIQQNNNNINNFNNNMNNYNTIYNQPQQINQVNQIKEYTQPQPIIQTQPIPVQQKPQQPQICCYCSSTFGVVECADCNKMICNGPIFNSNDCQILTHIRLCHHTNIKINGNLIECSVCKDSNVFNLRYSVKCKRIVCHTCLNQVAPTFEDKMNYNTSIVDEGHFDLTYFEMKSSSIPVKKDVIVSQEKNSEKKERQGTGLKRNYKTPKETYSSSKEYFDVYQPLFGLEEFQQRKIEEGDYKFTEAKDRVKFIKDNNQLKLEIMTKNLMKGLSRSADFIICLDGKPNIIDINDLDAIYHKQSNGKFTECKKVFFGKIDSWNSTKVKINLFENYFEDMKMDYNLSKKQIYDKFVIDKHYKIVRWYCIFNPEKPLNPVVVNSLGSLENTSYGKTLLGTLHPPEDYFDGNDLSYELRLNPSQKKAVLRALNNQVSVIFGPPGSGKTSTIVSIALNYLKHFDDIVDLESVAFEMETNQPIQPKVLTCAPSNAAVNILAERLEEFKLRVCRIISIEKLDDLKHELWNQCIFNWALKYANDHPEESKQFTYMIKDYSKSSSQGFYGYKQQKQRNQMVESQPHNVLEYLQELKARQQQRNVIDMDRSKKDIIDKFISRKFKNIIEDSNCVCCSTKACTKKYFQDIRFVCTIMDEATQAVELDTLVPALKSTRLVLVGDLQQLNSIIVSKEAEHAGYGKSMFERLLNCNVTRTTLKEQYRMHPAISKMINAMFYDKMLIDKTAKKPTEISLFPNKDCPFMFICHRGKERYIGKGSVFNDTEVEIVKRVLDILMNENGIPKEKIGVISPYVAQKEEIGFEGTTSSVDGFQGSEKEYIVLSTVRSNQTKGAGFVGEYRRINVALSRAKHGLIVVGNEQTLGISPVWKKVFNYLSRNDSIVMYEDGEFKPFNYITSSDDNYEESEYKCYFLQDN